jgi:putative phage-type endonuclease
MDQAKREKWLAERIEAGVGGSEAPAVLGISPWATPYDVYLTKRKEAPPVEQTEPMRWGNILEPVIIQEYSNRTGRVVATLEHEIVKSDTMPWMFCTPDGICGERLIQAKTARTREGYGESGSDEIPEVYLIQVQHEMLVTLRKVADVPVLFGGSDFDIFTVEADQELQEMIAAAEHDFWFNHVKRGVPPAAVTLDDARRRYKLARATEIQADQKTAVLCSQLLNVRADLKRYEEEKERLQVAIMNVIGNNETLKYGSTVLATWKQSKAIQRFDMATFKVEHSDLHERYMVDGEGSRRFLIKEINK